jgi:lysophospholipase L1-like esterase
MAFPRKTALALATCVVALAVVHLGVPGKGLSLEVFGEAARLRGFWPQPTGALDARVPPRLAIPSPAPGGKDGAPAKLAAARPALADFLFDEGGSLDGFFDRLRRLETGEGAGQVSILHYGDSPTTADLITGDVRSLLQKRFGEAGYGYLLVAKPWAWYGHRGTDLSDHGWTISTAVGKGRAEAYGLGGASFVGSAGEVSSHITLKDGAESAMELAYLAQPGGGTVAVMVEGQTIATVDTASAVRQPGWQKVALPAGTKAVDLKVASGRVELFGETFSRSQRGILYDSLGLNGASTTVLSRGFDTGVWATELQHEQPSLVVINYGTNESGFGAFVDHQYEGELRLAIQKVRNALPNVSILVMSPMDRGERSGIDEIQTMSTIPRVVAIQKRVAADTQCAFFDTFNAMGGDGTMSRWYSGSPRLVAGDLIHPTPQGAAIIAQIFVKSLMQAYDGYRGRAASATVAPVVSPETPQVRTTQAVQP